MGDGNSDNFACSNCHAICDWRTRAHVRDPSKAGVKTIGSKYCDAPACIEADAKANGVSIEKVTAWLHGART